MNKTEWNTKKQKTKENIMKQNTRELTETESNQIKTNKKKRI